MDAELELLFDSYGFVRREPDLEAVTAIEKVVDFKLPGDYSFFISNYLGFEGFIGKQYLHLYKAKDILEMNKGYEIFEQLDNALLIGSNGAGEAIVIQALNMDSCKICIVPFIGMSKEYCKAIGDSFSNMLVRISQGEEWFK